MVTKIFFLLTILISSSSCASENKKDVREIKWKKVFVPRLSMSIEYPSDWNFIQEDDLKITRDVYLQGPKGCYKAKKRCGGVFFRVYEYNDKKDLSFYRKWLINQIRRKNSTRELLKTEKLFFGKFEAFALIRRRKKWVENNGGYRVLKMIYFKDVKKNFYEVNIQEDFYDRKVIKSPDDWELTKTYDRILSSIKFGPPK